MSWQAQLLGERSPGASYTRRDPRGRSGPGPLRGTGPGGGAIGWSFKIGRVLGAEVRIHWILAALFVVFALRALLDGGLAWLGFTAAAMGLVLACIFLHEVGHVLAGLRAGGWAEQILLWPLGGLASLRGVPPFPRPQIKVAASGPMVNLTLATAFLGILVLLNVDLLGRDPFVFGHRLLLWLFWANAVMSAVNLLPAFPLDGGDIFRWALAGAYPMRGYAWATLVGVKLSKVLAVILGVAGVVLLRVHDDSIYLFILAVVVFLSAERERRQLEFAAAAGVAEDEEGEFNLSPAPPVAPAPPPGFWERWRNRRRNLRREREVRHEVEVRKRVDGLLEKIAREGLGALSEKEKAFLRDASKRYQKDPTA